jgi:hypothetical protein
MKSILSFGVVYTFLVIIHLVTLPSTEPWFNNDETRHFMTGVFFHDWLASPTTHVKSFATQYYLQYPALGILVWPPLLHFIEGCWMQLFGIGFESTRYLILFFLGVSLYFIFGLYRLYFDRVRSLLGVLLVGISPIPFQFSQHVMGEIPCFAFAMGTVFFFESYLKSKVRRHAILACLFASMTFLTRFDALFLLPYFAIRLIQTSSITLILRREVLLGILLAIVLTLPYYLLTLLEYGGAISKTASSGTQAIGSGSVTSTNLYYYLTSLPEQVGWTLTFSAILAISFTMGFRITCFPALIASVYLTFSPMAELEVRHAIYWIPSIVAILLNVSLRFRFSPILIILSYSFIVSATIYESLSINRGYVRGYEEAARYTLQHSATNRCLIDAYLNGNFIYQVRRHDPERLMWCLRGDKLLYSMFSEPKGGYEEWAKTDREVLEILHRYDPELIILEEPQVWFETPGATRLREVIRTNPDRFVLVQSIPVESNKTQFKNITLHIYRKVDRNPNRIQSIEYQMLNLDHPLKAGSN